MNFILIVFCDGDTFFEILVSPVGRTAADVLTTYKENHGSSCVTFNLEMYEVSHSLCNPDINQNRCKIIIHNQIRYMAT